MWTTELVKRSEDLENKIVRDVDHWIDSIMGGFITEFVIDTSTDYSEVEHMPFKGLSGKYLKFLKTWIRCYCVKSEL